MKKQDELTLADALELYQNSGGFACSDPNDDDVMECLLILAEHAVKTLEAPPADPSPWSYVPSRCRELVWYRRPGDPTIHGKEQIWLAISSGALFCGNTLVSDMLAEGCKFAKVEYAPPPPVCDKETACE